MERDGEEIKYITTNVTQESTKKALTVVTYDQPCHTHGKIRNG